MDESSTIPFKNVSEQVINFLMRIPIFDSMTGEELRTISRHMRYIKLEKGETIFKEGDTGHYVCFLTHGSLDVLKSTDMGTVALATLHKGRSIGEMAIIDEFPRSATVKTRTKATLIVVYRKDFNLILTSYPKIGIKILKGISRLLSQNLRKASSRLADYMLPVS